MEIEITAHVTATGYDRAEFSASVAETGCSYIGRLTWEAAQEEARNAPRMLDTDEKLDAMRAFARSSGGWDSEEVAAWAPEEVEALFIQWIAGDLSECECENPHEQFSPEWWAHVEELQQDGRIPSNIFRSTEGRIYFGLYA